MDIEKSIRKIDAALAAVREEAIKRLAEQAECVVGLEIPLRYGGVREPRWWSKKEGKIRD